MARRFAVPILRTLCSVERRLTTQKAAEGGHPSHSRSSATPAGPRLCQSFGMTITTRSSGRKGEMIGGRRFRKSSESRTQ